MSVLMMLGAMLAFTLLAWVAALSLVCVAVVIVVKGVAMLVGSMRRLLVVLRIMKPTTAFRSNCATDDIIDV